jgi:uncharacterized protein
MMLDRIADGRTDLVFDYVAAGHAANSADSGGVSLIRWCAYYGDVSAIRFLLAHGESLLSLGENLDLNGAAFHGHWRLCQFLIEHGGDVTRPLAETGETPLHAALCKASSPAYDHVVSVLLAGGANPNSRTKPAVPTGCFMRDCRTKAETPLHRAAAFGSAAAIRMLLEAGATIDVKDMNGDTPLNWASWHNRPAFILERLCYGGMTIHPEAVKQSLIQHGIARNAMEVNLLGTPHV